jgi:chaperonin GroEL (HSP60 family)
MLEDVKPAEIKRFLKWKAKELVEFLDKAAKEENEEESAYEITTTTAYLAAITVFVLAGILFHL